jgi:hypothetical protein
MFISKRKVESLQEQVQDLNERMTKLEGKVVKVQEEIGDSEDGKRHLFGWDISRYSLTWFGSPENNSVPPKELTMWETINQIMDAADLHVSKTNAVAKVVKDEEPKAPVKRKRKAAKKGKK